MEFSRPEYYSGWLFPSPGHLPNPGIKPRWSWDCHKIEIQCRINVIHLNHPQTIPLTPDHGKIIFQKPVPGAKKVGEHCSRVREWKRFISRFLGYMFRDLCFEKRRGMLDSRGKWREEPQTWKGNILKRKKMLPSLEICPDLILSSNT